MHVKRWPVDVEVTLKVAEDRHILAIITNEGAEDLGLEPGRKVLALVKSSFIHLYAVEHAPAEGKNCFIGEVTERTDAERNSEILLDIGQGKTLHAVIPRQIAEDLALERGGKAAASFDASHVILAVN